MDAGWYPDPERGGTERWWDGVGWTEFRRHIVPADSRRVAATRSVTPSYDDANPFLSIIVASPIWLGVSYHVLSMASVTLLQLMPYRDWMLIKPGFFAVVTLVLVALSGFDRAVLRARGFATPPSTLWMIATPIAYLWVRARTVDGADRRPLVIHLGLLGVTCFAILLGIALGMQFLAA